MSPIPDAAIAALRSQWSGPNNILDLLLIVGGDIVKTQMTRFSSAKWPAPAAFSFGCVAYAFVQLASIIGGSGLLQSPDGPAMVINGESGYVRENSSWLLARLLRDFESRHWMTEGCKKDLDAMLNGEGKSKAGLCISFFAATSDIAMPVEASVLQNGGTPAIRPQWDLVWVLGWAVILVQIVVSLIPWWMWNRWQVFLVTACGTMLSLSAAHLPQWRHECWSCRRVNRDTTYILTRGNGAQHAVVVFAERGSLDLEDLASWSEAGRSPMWTRLVSIVQVVLWLALLIMVDGLKNDTWILITIGGLGMMYAVVVGSIARVPEALGIRLEPNRRLASCPTSRGPLQVIMDSKVMISLMDLEMEYHGVGKALLNTFFPGDLTAEEKVFWQKVEQNMQRLSSPSTAPRRVKERAEKYTDEITKQIEAGNRSDKDQHPHSSVG